MLTPLQNQFIKYFVVLHNYVVFNNSQKSQFIDFIEGYLQEFPSEASTIRTIYQKALGEEYTNNLPPPLWVLIKNHSHRLLVFDPFDAITVPVYTFDLNAAEVGDLLTIKDLSKSVAEKIVAFRNDQGFFTDMEQLRTIPELPEDICDKIISAAFDDDYFQKTFTDFQPKLSIASLILHPLKYILSRAAVYFILLFSILYFAVIKRYRPSIKQSVLLFSKYFILWIFLVLTGLSVVFIAGEKAYLFYLLLTVTAALIALLIYRKKKVELRRTLLFIATMCLLVMLSIL